MSTRIESVDCYDYPQYWDLAFRSETRLESDFFEAAFAKYARGPVERVVEPGCGGGRLVVEMAVRGFDVAGFDLSHASIAYLRKRLRRRRLSAEVFTADMTQFRLDRPADAAFCTMNTFRHLTSERLAQQHLQTVAENLRPGGIYILGFHLLPPDADLDDAERWTAKHGRTHVTLSLRVVEASRRTRLETIRFNLRVRSAGRDLKLRSDYRLRIYTAAQFRRLLSSVPEWELCDVFDFWYDIQEPLTLDNRLGDVVFVLRKR